MYIVRTCVVEALCFIDSINTFRLSSHERAKMLPDRAALMFPRGSLFLLDVTSFGMPFRLDWMVPVTVMPTFVSSLARTRVEPIHVEIISLIVERLYQRLHYPNGVGKIILYQLSFLAVVHTHPLKVSCSAV